MHSSAISIWFFIGVLLAVYGGLIFGYGVYEWASSSYPVGVQLTRLHTPVWWGAVLFLVGVFYLVRFKPGRDSN
ncbi:MAG: hypothetical protein WBV28_06035 [Terracidiphilus sp.]